MKVGVEPEKQGSRAIVWILAVICTVLFVWYFGLRKQPIQESGGTMKSTSSSAPSWSGSSDFQKTSDQNRGELESTNLTSLEIKTSPQDAQLFVDGQLQAGRTPLTVDKIQVGKEVELKTQLFGFLSQTQKVVPEEKTVQVDMVLKPASMKITFEGKPAGAVVKVSGKRWGQIPETFTKKELKPELSYVVLKAGYTTFNGTITSKDWTEKDGVFLVKVTVALNKKEVSKPVPGAPALEVPEKTPAELIVEKLEPIAEPYGPAAEPKPELVVEKSEPEVEPYGPAAEPKPDPVEEAPSLKVAEDKPTPKTKKDEKKKVETNPEPSPEKAPPSTSSVDDNPF